jgi:hypothetical protein
MPPKDSVRLKYISRLAKCQVRCEHVSRRTTMRVRILRKEWMNLKDSLPMDNEDGLLLVLGGFEDFVGESNVDFVARIGNGNAPASGCPHLHLIQRCLGRGR